ncbi:hypothetical protein QBC39DRAFT_181281 [Podospora conica]|nr:hypothetical protein QBC39DRAFT_181281 [Schizothecium conicum]
MGFGPDKHKSSHSSRGKQKESSRSHKASSGSSSSRGTAASFLFVVNEFDFEDGMRDVDQWFNYMPPTDPGSYHAELAGSVFRYRNGVVTPAPEFEWFRGTMEDGSPGRGCIARRNPEYDQYVAMYPERMLDVFNPNIPMYNGFPPQYLEHSVFACSPFVPIIVLQEDASLGSVIRRRCACGEGHLPDHLYSWNLLHFINDDYGVSRATVGVRGTPYVGGRAPSWMPSLVPRAFENRLPRAVQNLPASQGLAGDLPIVIALMAFHGAPGHASNVFAGGKWHHNQWHGSPNGQHFPATGDSPRGFLVHVCLDLVPEDMDEATLPHLEAIKEAEIERLGILQWEDVLVQG